uniref:SMC_N domain-containing protein n=1 Tax=Angiostrongylus cantonensis TaxID=6313 RepID=A0A0K0CZK8_ANGCA
LGAVIRTCSEMGVKLIVRAHNPLEDGICWIGKRKKLLSLWSAPAKNSKKVRGERSSIHPPNLSFCYALKMTLWKPMELPFVYIDPHEQNEDIASIAPFLGQARRILVNKAISDEMKKAVFDIAMECITDVKRYYEAKEKDTHLLKRDPEIEGKLCQAERELAEKERINSGLRACIQEKKRNIQFSELTLKRSRTKTSDLLRQRKELGEECKKLTNEVERNNAVWASSLQTACKQRDRLQALMDQSPRLAQQNIEQNAVTALEMRLEELKLEYNKLEQEEARLKRELEFQIATPLRVYMVNFAKITLRTLEMQEKLGEARKIFKQLKAEEMERIKSGASEYDAFDASFMSLDYNLRKAPDHVMQCELLRPTAVSKTLEPVDEESSCSGTPTTGSSSKSPLTEPPQNTEEDVMRARTDAVKNYVNQQSESISRQVESHGSGSGEKSRNDVQHGFIYNLEKIGRSHRMAVEVMSTTNGQNAQPVLDNDNVNENSDEDMDVKGIQGISRGDFSDEDFDGEDVVEGGCTAMEEGNQDEGIGSQGSVDSSTEETILHGNKDYVGTVTTISTKDTCQPHSSADKKEASSSKSLDDVLNVATPSPCMGASQEADDFFSPLLSRPTSPIEDEMPFTFTSGANDEEFDPTMVLNISSHSNDPGADFLSLMESTHGRRERERQSEGSGCAVAEFSFSMFGASDDVEGASEGIGGDFAFDFGNPSQNGDEGDNGFEFNFGGISNDNTSNDKDVGFNFFGF